jgi:hypothetical protein
MPPPPNRRMIWSRTRCSCFEPLYHGTYGRLSPSTIKTPSRWTTCTKWQPTHRGKPVPKLLGLWQPSMRTATLRPTMRKTRLLPSRTGRTRGSKTNRRNQILGYNNATIVTAPTAKFRITPKINAAKESGKINHAETNKDLPTGPKCM